MLALYCNCRMLQTKRVDGKSQKLMLDIQFRLSTEMLLCDTYSRIRQYHYTNEYYLAVQLHWPFNSFMRMTPHDTLWSDRSGYYTPLVWQWCVCSPTAQQNILEGTAHTQEQERIPLPTFNKKALKLFVVHIVP